MLASKQKIHEIIHTASDACAGMNASDSADMVPIQTSMILAIASEQGIEMTHAAAADLLIVFTETARSRQALSSRHALAGWLPGIDNTDNDSTAEALTEAIGWTANSHFEKTEAK